MAELRDNPSEACETGPLELAFLQNEELFRHAFGYAAIGMALVGLDGRLLKVNPSFCELVGYTEEELLALHFQEITHHEDVEGDVRLLEQTLAGERRSYQMEKRYVSKQGLSVWVILNAWLVRDESGAPLYFVAQVQDITSRKQTERELEESRLRYDSLLQHNPDMICTLDEATGKLLSINPAALEITGYSQEELLNRSFLPCMAAEDWPRVWKLFAKARQGLIDSAEISLLHKLGDVITLEVSCVPIWNREQLQGIHLIARDITKRKSTERTIERLHDKNRLILNAVSDGIFGIDEQQGTIFWNDAAERLTGYSHGEMLGKNAYRLLTRDQTDDREGSPLARSMLEGAYYHIANEVFCRKDGETFPVEYMVCPIYEHGQVIGGVVTFKDITERQKTEELLRKSEKLSVVGQMAAGVAHEIRNPLTSVKGFLQFMQSGASSKQEYYDIMLSELGRIEMIITEMLVLAKPQVLRYQPCSIETILRQVMTLLETQAILSDIQFRMVIERGLPLVLCEENQLKQVFVNLIRNAMEAMPDGGQIDVRVGLDDTGRVNIALKDRGCGIPPERLSKLGEPFYTTKEKGTGLGMMITYKIIEDHKGTMHIESSVGKGTVVSITLPVTGD
ncbi:PAS domain S-box protein [Paenibacillus athensensis]|uniref:histidine kinase n=1 Tax=Paenibacillus athensensis TaxID=1967502 RepID=A0A4Y8PV45_9BACL|nr:PAS domain S-box protein [Paenibacillus athensensis]MCD1261730.1 PAS domain S-box protein [Paenibacillus athensensis]